MATLSPALRNSRVGCRDWNDKERCYVEILRGDVYCLNHQQIYASYNTPGIHLAYEGLDEEIVHATEKSVEPMSRHLHNRWSFAVL